MTPEQRKAYAELDALLDEGQFPEAIAAIKSWDQAVSKVWLNQFYQASTYRHRYELLKQEPFDELWLERLKALKLPNNPNFNFTTQSQISNSDFVLGYVFHLLALNAMQKAKTVDAADYLKLGLELNSIHAAQTSLSQLLKQESTEPNAPIEKFALIAAVLDSWKNLAAKHGTPGYLLLANGYLQLVKIALDHQPTMTAQYNEVCFLLWKNLTMAENAERQSTASIHNAYFGQGLKLSNPLGLSTIDEMKEQAAGRLIADSSIKLRAEKSASEEVSDDASNAQYIAWMRAKNRRLHVVSVKEQSEEHQSRPPSP